jgi:hypothetical protein
VKLRRPIVPVLGWIAAAMPALAGGAVVVTTEGPAVEVQKSSISTVVTNELVMQLPTARNAQELLTLTLAPGPAGDPVPGVDAHVFKIGPPKSLKGRPTFPEGTTIDFGSGGTHPLGDRYAIRRDAGDHHLTFKIRRPGEKAPAVEGELPIGPNAGPAVTPVGGANSYAMPPVALAGRVNVIRGPLSGDGTKTIVRIGDRKLSIVAENERSVFFRIPDDFVAGEFRVELEDGGRRVEIPITVLRMTMAADQLKLRKGQTTKFHVAISGPESWDAGVWRPGIPSDLCDVTALARKFPEFRPPAPGADGFLLFSITNLSPSVIAIDEFARSLSKKDFSGASYRYDAGIVAVSDGGFGIHGEVQAFLAPNTAEGHAIEPATPEKK